MAVTKQDIQRVADKAGVTTEDVELFVESARSLARLAMPGWQRKQTRSGIEKAIRSLEIEQRTRESLEQSA